MIVLKGVVEMIWLLIVGVLILIFMELPALYKQKQYKEIGVFIILLLIGFYLGMVQIYDWPFYNPLLRFYAD